MIYNARNRSNNTTESQKGKKAFLMYISVQSVSVKNHRTKITLTRT